MLSKEDKKIKNKGIHPHFYNKWVQMYIKHKKCSFMPFAVILSTIFGAICVFTLLDLPPNNNGH